jgi:NAD+ kinase
MKNHIHTLSFFSRKDIPSAAAWEKKIATWIRARYPAIRISRTNPDALIVLGGDGTILEAARKYGKQNPIIFGLNLGHVGFLASVREPRKFLPSLRTFLNGDFRIAPHMMLAARVMRGKEQVFETQALNDLSIQNPLGMVTIEAHIERHPFQRIHGTGVLIATATGSTAYNLSAHGPIVTPGIECFIVTELLDHNIPTPSIIVKPDKEISLHIANFRKRGLLSMSKTKEPIDVILAADSEIIFPLHKGDKVIVTRSPQSARFAEIEKNYFLKSLEEKFGFR